MGNDTGHESIKQTVDQMLNIIYDGVAMELVGSNVSHILETIGLLSV